MISRSLSTLLAGLCLSAALSLPACGGNASAGFEEVRCFQHRDEPSPVCYGRLGNLWASVGPAICAANRPRYPMDRNATACSGVDDSTGWDETWCDGPSCYGRLGNWITILKAECESMGTNPYDGTPAQLFCGEAETPSGWDNVQCFNDDVYGRYCPGSHEIYYPAVGLAPTCALEAERSENEAYTEVMPDPEHCD